MKKYFILATLLAAITPANAAPTLTGKAPLVIGHRGASGYLPDHTLASYRKAIEMGADYIEPDLVSTKDGVLIVRHETTLKDSSDIASLPEFAVRKRKFKIDGIEKEGWFTFDLTLAEIKTLRAIQPRADRPQAYNGQFQIVTFDELLTLREEKSKETGREIGIYPETKHSTLHQQLGLPLEEKLVAALAKHGLNHKDAPVFIQSFETHSLKTLRKLTPVKLVFLVDGHDVRPDGSIAANRPYDYVISGDPRSYADMMTPAGLHEIRQFADGIGPWKAYLIGWKYKTGADGKIIDLNGDKETDQRDAVLLPPSNLVHEAHKAGLLVHPFTFRNEAGLLASDYKGRPEAEYLAYFALGVDGVFSDFSDTAVAARKHFLTH